MASATSRVRWRRRSPAEKREAIWGIFFLSPWIIGFFLFIFIPLVTAFSYSFMNYNTMAPDEATFAGLDNYIRLLGDEIAWRSLFVTAVYVFIWTPISVGVPLFLATLLHSKYLIGGRFFRLGFYLPTLVPEIAVFFIIGGFFFGRGWFYQLFLQPFNIDPDNMAFSSFVTLVIFSTSLWGIGNLILILLAGKQGVPEDLYEAAEVDGAGFMCKYVKITLPFMSPIIFYSLIISLITAFQLFAAPFLLGGAGFDQDNPAMFFTVYIVSQLTIFQDLGYAATLGWLLTLFIAIVAGLVFISSRYWVFYGDES